MEFSTINMDIAHRIIYWCTLDIDRRVDYWANALSLLAVCSSWRRAGLKKVYSNLFIGETRFYQKGPSNAALIINNGFGNIAKRMIVDDCRWNYFTEYIIGLVGATESNCPGVDKFMKGMPLCDKEYDEFDSDLEDRCYCYSYKTHHVFYMGEISCPNKDYHDNAANIHPKLADMLKSKLPNINVFYISQNWMRIPDVNIFDNILKRYEKQITELEYNGPELDIKLESPHLTSIAYYNIYSHCMPFGGIFHISYPQLLRRMKIEHCYIFDIADDNSYFDSLEELHVFNDFEDDFDFDQYCDLEKYKTRLPKLKRLFLGDALYVFDGCCWNKVHQYKRLYDRYTFEIYKS